MVRHASLIALASCWTAPAKSTAPAPVAKPAPVVATCNHRIFGALHDEHGPLPGATVELGNATTLTDAEGSFTLDQAEPAGHVTIFVADLVAQAEVPDCITSVLVLQLHGMELEATTPGTPVVDDSPRIDAIATQWIDFYQRLMMTIDAAADCTAMGTSLEAFVAQNQSAIDVLQHQRETLPSSDRYRVRDAITHNFQSEQMKQKLAGCRSDSRVRAAVKALPQ
ncbi:MAG: carboxypeptidase-like regulatory domain-containing protein [Kofleriaceae bacterium]